MTAGMNDRRDQIRKAMMVSFWRGGKRCKILWLNRWYGAGDGQFPMSYIRQAALIVLGLVNLGDFLVTHDYAKFGPILAFLVAWVPLALSIGFLKHWLDFSVIEAHIGNIMNPMYHDVQDVLNGGAKKHAKN